MFKVILTHYIYEICLTKFFDNVSLNLFTKIPIPDKHFDYEKCKDKWYPVIISNIGGTIPEYAMKMFVHSMENQLIFNKEHTGMSYQPFQQYSLPIIRRMFGNENISQFNIGKKYDPQYKGTVSISKSTLDDLSYLHGDKADALILEMLIFEMNSLIVGEELNGILMRFTENTLAVYI